MNICILPYAGRSFAPFRPEAEIFIGLARKGFNITMLIDTDLEYVSMFSEVGINLVPFSTNKKVDFSAIKIIRQTIDQYAIDLVYATYSRFISNAAFACIGKPVKMVAYRGTTGGLYRYDPSRYLGVLHPRVDGIICVSQAVQQHVSKYVSARVKPYTRAIYKGHDLDWYRAPATDLKQFGSDSSRFNIACIASDRPHKGLIDLLHAAKHLARHENIHIILIGNEPKQQIFLDAIEASGMKERVHLTGYRQDAAQIMAACDVLVFPSYRKEGLPRTLLESLANATPAIAAAIPSSAEVITDNVNGYLVSPQDPGVIAEKVIYLYNNRQELDRLSSNCRQVFADKMSHKTTVDAYAQYFQSLDESK